MKLLPVSTDELREKLQDYLKGDPDYKKIFEYTKQRFEADAKLTAHNWEHTYRDTINSVVIGEAEQADMRIVLPAATMHDIGFLYGASGKTHGAVGADNLVEFLKDADVSYTENETQRISDCIRTHKGSMHGELPQTIEAKVVADADMLEKFGPFGVYQHIRTFTESNRSINAVLERQLKSDELTLETETGKKLAEPGRQFVKDFYANLADAYEPYQIKEDK